MKVVHDPDSKKGFQLRIATLEKAVLALRSENAALVKKIDASETMGDAILENLRKMLEDYVNEGKWACQHWQTLAMLLSIVGGRSWRTDSYLRDMKH